MNQKYIEKVKEILTAWNPLGDRAKEIKDLNNYETEAVDIIFHVNTEIHFKRKGDSLKRVQLIMKEVIEGAFSLDLDDDECRKPAEEIYNILSKT